MTDTERANLQRHYSRASYPRAVWDRADSPWIICADASGNCAAIPRRADSGHLPSHYGNLAYVATIKRHRALARLTRDN